mgnify:CR=1 FL=1
MIDRRFKISEHGIARASRLRLPRAYYPYQKLTCCHSGATEWTDYGRLKQNKPLTWRVSLRYRSIKPPCTNRGVSQWTTLYWRCDGCNREMITKGYYTGKDTSPNYCYDCIEAIHG